MAFEWPTSQHVQRMPLLQSRVTADHGDLDLGQILLEEGGPMLEAIGQSRDEIGLPIVL